MAEDLVKRLDARIGKSRTVTVSPGLYEDIRDAKATIEAQAASLAAKDKEIERLRHTSVGDWASQRENDSLTIELYELKDRAEQAERALAEAVEVMRPFAAGSIDVSGAAVIIGYPEAEPALKTARAFVSQHGSDSREGK